MPPASSGKYLIVWRKDADGVWRIAACAATANPNPDGVRSPLIFRTSVTFEAWLIPAMMRHDLDDQSKT